MTPRAGSGDRVTGAGAGSDAGGPSGGSAHAHFSVPRSSAAVFLVSTLVLALQIAFIRALSLDTYHHFTYLVISTALLGFGASGTALSLARRWIERHFEILSAVLLVLLVVSSAFAYRVAVALRPDMQYVLFSSGEVLKLWAHTLVLFVPFFAGGAFVGMALSRFRTRVGLVYGANMVGSGLGGVAGVMTAFVVTPYRMPVVLSVLGIAALVLWVTAWPGYRRAPFRLFTTGAFVGSVAAVVVGLVLPFGSSVDQYKPMAQALRLSRQGDARHVAQKIGPRAQIDLFDVPSMHHTLFAAPTAAAPPEQLSLFMDGAHAGGVFRIEEAGQAEVLRDVAQALPYRMVDAPEVLILGEQTGVNVWMALAHGAQTVTVVQPNPQLIDAAREAVDSSVFDRPEVRVVSAEPRLFLSRAGQQFDIIHLASAEGMPAGSGGLASMREDYTLTVEAMRAALERLTPSGLLTVTRGMQTPPRDNVRLFALFEEALRTQGGGGAQRAGAAAGDGEEGGAGNGGAAQRAAAGSTAAGRLLQARNYLAVTTVAAAEPLGQARIDRFHSTVEALSMDADYYPGISPAELTERNRVSGPEGGEGSYYYHAAQRILAGEGEREAFFSDWVYNVRPPNDNRPYFHSFFRWDSLSRYIESYGQFWFQRLELGYAVVVVTFLQVLIAALVLVLAPVLVLRRKAPVARGEGGRGAIGWTVLHFTAIGLGFLFIEMLHIQRITRFLGDPIYSTAAVLTAILVFSGVGSYVQGRIGGARAKPRHTGGDGRQESSRMGRLLPSRGMSAAERIRFGGAAVAALALVYYAALDPVLNVAIGAGEPLRFVVSLIMLFPISFMLGWLMPAGLEAAGRVSGDLIPLAWAVNGVASVAATPLSVMVASGVGFFGVTLLAAVCYLVVALAAPRR